jgi:hypothetical protein
MSSYALALALYIFVFVIFFEDPEEMDDEF